MNLFHETENKYYELLSYMINDKGEYSAKEINEYIAKHLVGEQDYEVIDSLFVSNEDEENVFAFADGKYYPVLPDNVPIRVNQIEASASKSMIENCNAKHFLSQETIDKLRKSIKGIPQIWDINHIEIKNQYLFGVSESASSYEKELSIIAQAISEHRAITYDNILPGKYEFRDAQVYPIRIEYSFLNDLFRINAYSEDDDRFIKINLASMSNIRLADEQIEDLEKEYKEYIQLNTKKIELDVDPIEHVIERCFRIFSFYDRQARFDKEDNKYKLTISYLKADENEVLRDIMSLGSYVVVMEPRRIQKEIYKRLVAARDNYKN